MAITYPGTLDTFVNPTGTSTLDSPDHALQHSNVNDAIEAVQAVVGTTAGTAALMDFAAGDFALERSGGTATNLSLAGTPVLDATSAIPFYKDSIYRQAIINGNFDIWQRGTSIAMTTADAYAADRWYCETATAATDKTVSRQTASNNGSYYSARVAMVQDTDELLTFSQALDRVVTIACFLLQVVGAKPDLIHEPGQRKHHGGHTLVVVRDHLCFHEILVIPVPLRHVLDPYNFFFLTHCDVPL